MSQVVWSSINPTTTSGSALASILNDFKNAVMSGLSGTSRPSQTTPGGGWIDTTNEGTPNFYWSYKVWTGTFDVEIFRVNLTTGTASISGADSEFDISRISADTVGALLKFIKRRIANNGQVLSGDVLAELRSVSRTNSSTDPVVAVMKVVATENHTTSASGAYLSIEVTPTGSTSAVEILRITGGNIGIGTTTPTSKLHVEGSTGIKSSYTADSANGAKIVTEKSRVAGTKATQNADVIGQWDMNTTDDASAQATSGQIVATATEAHTAASQGTQVEIKTADNGTNSPTVGMTIGSKVETNKTLKVNSLELVNQNIATTATITQLSATKTLVEFTGSTATSVQGINSGHASKVLTLHNRSSANVILRHENAGATAADRLKLPSASDITIEADSSVELFYCTADSRWKVKSAAGTGSGGGGGTTSLTYTANDTLVVPAGVNAITVKTWGGGGGGGGGCYRTGTLGSGGGGGGGGAAHPIVATIPVTPGDTLTITIGAGGTAGAGGVQGTATLPTRGGDGNPTTITGTGVYHYSPGGGGGGGGGLGTVGGVGTAGTAGKDGEYGLGGEVGTAGGGGSLGGGGGGGGGGCGPGRAADGTGSTAGFSTTPVQGSLGTGGAGACGGSGITAGAGKKSMDSSSEATGGSTTGSGGGAARGGGGGGGGTGRLVGGAGGNGADTPVAGTAAAANSGAGGGGGGGKASNANGNGAAGGAGGSGYAIITY